MLEPHSQSNQSAADRRSSFQLSVSNVRPKLRIVSEVESGIDLDQAPLQLFETALAGSDSRMARDALLAYRHELEGATHGLGRTSMTHQSEHSTVQLSSASDTVDKQSTHSGDSSHTTRFQGGRLEKLISDMESEIRDEYESNWRKSVEALSKLERTLAEKTADRDALEERVVELEAALGRQRNNHATQVAQLTDEYEERLAKNQAQAQQQQVEFEQRVVELSVNRDSTIDEIEVAWKAIADSKQRWQTEREARQLDWETQKSMGQEQLKQDCNHQLAELENRKRELGDEISTQQEQLKSERAELQESSREFDLRQALAAKRLAVERETIDRERATWRTRVEREEAELAALREAQDQERSRVEAEIGRAKAEWKSMRERKSANLNDELSALQQTIDQARSELDGLLDQQRQLKQELHHKLGTLDETFNERADRQRVELEQELIARRCAWREEQKRERASLDAEKESLRTAAEQMQAVLARRKEQHAAELAAMRGDCERVNQDWTTAERTRLEAELAESSDSITTAQARFEEKCDEWTRQRDEEAALLRAEKERLRSRADQLHATESELAAEQSRLDAQAAQRDAARQTLEAQNAKALAEIEKARADSERLLHEAQQVHFEELRVRKVELARHQAIVDEKNRQREQEWVERQRQLEHDCESRRLLMLRDMEERTAQWSMRAEAKRHEIEAEERAIREQRTEWERLRDIQKWEIDAANRKLSSDRHMLQDGLNQMDAQLKWVAIQLGAAQQDVEPGQSRPSALPVGRTAGSSIRIDHPTSEPAAASVSTTSATGANASAALTVAARPTDSIADSDSACDVVLPGDVMDCDRVDEPVSIEIDESREAIESIEDCQDAADESVEDHDSSEVDATFERGWVIKLRETSALRIAQPAEGRVPAGGEPEWGRVVESAHVRALRLRENESVAEIHQTKSDPDSAARETVDLSQPTAFVTGQVEAPSDSIDAATIDEDDDTKSAAERHGDKIHRVDNAGLPASASDAERRKALKDYRVKLLDLRAQLGDLSRIAEQKPVDE